MTAISRRAFKFEKHNKKVKTLSPLFAKTTGRLFLTALLGASLWGCAAGGYGSLQHDPQVTCMYRSLKVPTDYDYYSIGRPAMPYAIIGLSPGHELASPYWEPVLPGSAAFAEKVNFIWDPHVWYQYKEGRGAWILGPGGEKIGLWYSMYPDAVVSVDRSGKVKIFSPHRPGERNGG
mgnify:CR=1 FL=1